MLFGNYRQALLDFVAELADSYVPNVCRIVGKRIAGMLLGEAGGL